MALAKYMDLHGDLTTEDEKPQPPVQPFAPAISPDDKNDSEHQDTSFFQQTAVLQQLLEDKASPGVLGEIQSFVGGLANNKSPGFLGSLSRAAGGIGLKLLNAVGITHTLSADAKQNIRNVMQSSLNVYGNDIIRARLSVAQAVLESGLMHKPSTLAERFNNLFGIKARNGDMAATMVTREVINGQSVHVNASFAAYTSTEGSIRAHAALLNGHRYTSVMNAQSFEEAAVAVQQSGYATDPDYARKLMQVDAMVSQFTNDMRPNAQVASNAHPPTASAVHHSVGGLHT